MADQIEKKVVLEVVAPDAVETVGQIKTNIKLLKEGWEDANGAFHKGLNDLKVGSAEYQNQLNELKLNQNMLKDANYATASSMQAVSSAAAGEGESYNALVHRMAALKEEYRTLDPSIASQAKRMGELSAQINETNNKLKAYDSMIGNHQRNVGNYTQSIMTAFNGVKIGGVNALGAVKGLKGGFDTLAASPILAVLTAIVLALQKLVTGFKNSEEATNSWARAFAAFQPIGDGFKRTMQEVSESIAETANKIVDLLYKWGLLDAEAGKHRQAMTEHAQVTRKLAREWAIENAQQEAEIAELRAKAIDEEKYTVKERIGFLEDAMKRERIVAKNRRELAQRRLEDAEAEADRLKNDAEANDQLAQARVELINVDKQAADTERTLQKQLNKLEKQAKAGAGAAKEDLSEIDALVKQIEADTDRAINSLAASIEAQEKAAEKAEHNRLKNVEEATARRQQDAEMEIDDARALEERKFEIAQDGLKRRAELLKQFYQDALARGDVELALEYEQQAQDLEYQIEYEGYMRRKALREKEVEQRKAALQGMVSATTSIMGAIADAYEAAGDLSEAEAQRVKALRIAATVIETIAGAVSAYMGTIKAMAGSPLAIPVAVASAGSVLATGYAQIAKMQNTDATGKSVSVSESRMQAVAVNAPTPVQMVPVTRSLTSASEEARLNEAQRVVIVDSDIKAAGRRAEVVDNETDLG